MNLTVFWILDARGVLRLSMAVWTVFRELVSLAVPLTAERRFAGPRSPHCSRCPSTWLERPEGRRARILAVQVVWAMALLAVGRVVLRRATRRRRPGSVER
ncbi:MAG: hypothetical protein R2705_07160 [Ilumatobacteraceae bacterium]